MKLDSIDFRSGDAKKMSDANVTGVNTTISFTSAELSGDSIALNFDYSALYAPDESYIRISGRAVFSGKESRKSHEEWTKTKRITGEAGEYMLNAVNYGSSMNAIMISKVFNMAPPVMLPQIVISTAAEKKK
jgi:hypothetical protein